MNKAKKCVIILEIEALPHEKFSIHSKPQDEVIECLMSLLQDNRNTIIIIGHQSKQTMEDWFESLIGFQNFYMAAESGFLYKIGKEHWRNLTETIEMPW